MITGASEGDSPSLFQKKLWCRVGGTGGSTWLEREEDMM